MTSIKFFFILLLLISCSEAQWTEEKYVEQFHQLCNKNKAKHANQLCDCQLSEAKSTYPDPQQFFNLPPEQMNTFQTTSFKQCVDWHYLSVELRQQCEKSVGQKKGINCQCNIEKLKEMLPNVTQYIEMSKEDQFKAATQAAILCNKAVNKEKVNN